MPEPRPIKNPATLPAPGKKEPTIAPLMALVVIPPKVEPTLEKKSLLSGPLYTKETTGLIIVKVPFHNFLANPNILIFFIFFNNSFPFTSTTEYAVVSLVISIIFFGKLSSLSDIMFYFIYFFLYI